MRGGSPDYKASSAFLACKDPKDRRAPRGRRVTPENQDSPEPKGPEDPLGWLDSLETQVFRVSLAKMVPQDPRESQDATGQRVNEAPWAPPACLASWETLGPPGSPE